MADPTDDLLVAELRALGGEAVPDPDVDHLARRVLSALPEAAPSRRPSPGRVALAVLAVLVALAATPPVLVPEVLGRPAGVEVSSDHRVVSMTWTAGGGVIRLDQFDGRLDFAMAKRSPEVRYAAVGSVDALWFEAPHEVVLLDADGSRRTETARLAGHTLIWPHGGTTMRLEGELSLEEAVAIGESARPVG